MNEQDFDPATHAGRFNLSAWALKHQSLVLYLMIMLSLAGVLAYTKLGQKEDPEFTFKAMVVRGFWPGASAGDVEKQLTDPLEKALQGIAVVDYTKSYSRAGEALIIVSLQETIRGKAVEDAWYQVRKRIADIQVTLPQGVVGPFFNDEFGETYGNLYAFTSDGFSMPELKDYVEDVRTELLRIKDVNKVTLIGTQDQKIYVEYSAAKLAAVGVSPFQINQVLAATNALTPAGVVEGREERVFVRVTGNYDAVAKVRDTVVDVQGKRFRLGDIANVYRATIDPPTLKMRYQGQPTIGLGVSMRHGGDVLRMGEQIDATLAKAKASLPVGVEFHPVSDQPAVVKGAVKIFMHSLGEAVLIVLAVSFLSLGWRTGIVVALSIPLVLALTFLGMFAAGIDLQRISLGALVIALGLLVDDAIIAVEMMALKLEQGWDRFRAATFAYTSTAMPMLTGTLITAAGFLPVGLAKSNAGEYTFSIFAVVGIALMLSWIVAVVFTPYIGFKLLPEQAKHEAHDVYQGRFYRRFRTLVTWCITWRKTTIAATAVAFIAAIVVFATLIPKQFFPASSRPELMVDLWLPYAASYQATEAEAKKLEAILMKDPDVESVTTYVGVGSPRYYLPLDEQMPNLNFAQLTVMTKGEKVRENVFKRVSTLFANDFAQVRGRVTRLENGPPVGYPLQFRVSGEDVGELRRIGEQVAKAMRANPHAREVHFDWSEKVKVLRIHADQDKLREAGLTTQQLAQYLQLAVSGVTATQYRENNELIDVVARLVPNERTSLTAIRDLPVKLASGRSVPLSQLGDVVLEAEESLIWRRNRVPTLSVRADVNGAQAPDIAKALQPEIAKIEAGLPAGYHIEVGGTLEASKIGEDSIGAVMPLMLIVVMTLLMIQLQSIQRMIMVLLTAPLGLIGVAIALLLFRAPFGFVATLGVIALSGMIMRNSVILMDQIEQDIRHGHPAWTAVIESAVRRFRPIMLTAAAAILAMIPLTRDTFWGPMAIAIMGGLFVATVLTLLFLPALYAAWFRVRPPVPERTVTQQ
ncbi:efflux RND transporter permease subunit [Jeongeupia naejangsanensis]|uniref:Efflux RND transporter permease subunit n=1 Tax=Jeongeupia naejangsanensis TaxID=613195 RepID=A0ABS2BRJ6_9NEIS|nr:efflux RND transporter permease subunit [Jeongeupia naejangsanensis]MBM3117606.1 efflux RND transporter permease subunit [Jeongeupia naejangsanensis]